MHVKAFARILLFLNLGEQRCRCCLDLPFRRRRPTSASSASRPSAGSTPIFSLRNETCCGWGRSARVLAGCVEYDEGVLVVGFEFAVLSVVVIVGELGSDIEGRLRYGIASLVEEKFWKPNTSRGVLGLSGTRISSTGMVLRLPIRDSPANIEATPRRIFAIVDDPPIPTPCRLSSPAEAGSSSRRPNHIAVLLCDLSDEGRLNTKLPDFVAESLDRLDPPRSSGSITDFET